MKTAYATIVLVLLLTSASRASDRELLAIARRVAHKLESGGYQRIAVVPVSELSKLGGESELRLGTTPRMLLYADILQAELTTQIENISVVDSSIAMSKIDPDADVRFGRPEELKSLSSAVGGLDAIVVLKVRETKLEWKEAIGRDRITGEEYYETRSEDGQAFWVRVLDIGSGELVDAGRTAGKRISLADAVLDGRSLELLRWQRGRLRRISFLSDEEIPGTANAPIGGLAKLFYGAPAINPAVNPNCPFKVSFRVDAKVREIQQSSKSESRAYLNLEAGEQYAILVKNGTTRDVRAAVFVDGINILGKRREIPNENCRVWNLGPSHHASFNGWYTKANGKDRVEEFIVVPREDSLAYKMGYKDELGQITIAFFAKSGDMRYLQDYPRYKSLFVDTNWNKLQRSWHIEEKLVDLAGAGPGGGGLATGVGRSRTTQLSRSSSGNTGVMLGAITVRYGPNSQIAKLSGNVNE